MNYSEFCPNYSVPFLVSLDDPTMHIYTTIGGTVYSYIDYV